jgi:hypothetical protein
LFIWINLCHDILWREFPFSHQATGGMLGFKGETFSGSTGKPVVYPNDQLNESKETGT